MKARIAAAEAAVEEAEQSAVEAVRLQNEIVQAASMAEGHSQVATSQSRIAERVWPLLHLQLMMLCLCMFVY